MASETSGRGAPATPARSGVSVRARRGIAEMEERIRALTTAPVRRGLVATAAAALLAVASLLAPWVVALTMAGLIIWFATGWMRLLALPSTRHGSVVIAAVGLASVAVAVGDGTPQHLIVAVAAGVVAAFVVEMARRDGRPRLVEDISGIVSGSIAAVCGAGWVLVADGHPVAAISAAGAIAAVSTIAATPWRGTRAMLSGPVVGALGALAGAALSTVVLDALGVPAPRVAPLAATILGIAIGTVTVSLLVLLSFLPPSGRKRPAAAAALLPVLLVGVPLALVASLLPG